MRAKIVKTLLILTTVLALGALEWITELPQRWFWQVLPVSLLRLLDDPEYFRGLGLTACACVFAWFVALAAGYGFGLIAALPALTARRRSLSSTTRLRKWADRFGGTIAAFYDGVYIIPVVITLNLVWSTVMYLKTLDKVSGWVVVLVPVAFGGLALGGYVVFLSLYRATTNPQAGALILVDALYRGQVRKPPPWLSRFPRSIRRLVTQTLSECRGLVASVRDTFRLRDSQIENHVYALELSLHLAIVAVVILESVTPNLYEQLLPQVGHAPLWLGGAGRLIQDAQARYDFELIAGILWAVVLFDLLLQLGLQAIVGKAWLNHYRRS